jgi:hypothetical protein
VDCQDVGAQRGLEACQLHHLRGGSKRSRRIDARWERAGNSAGAAGCSGRTWPGRAAAVSPCVSRAVRMAGTLAAHSAWPG